MAAISAPRNSSAPRNRLLAVLSPADLRAAVNEYHRRDRRFVAVPAGTAVPTERWLR